MDIVSRLKLFLNKSGIPNSQFADNCGIPRPTLSQLLNGRNKKVSDEVFTKIHNAYPQLNIMWLMFGDGEMTIDDGEAEQGTAEPKGIFATGGSLTNEPKPAQRQQQTTINFGPEGIGQRRSPTHALSDALQTIVGGGLSTTAQTAAAGQRQIKHILVLYNDGSVETYTPGAQQMAM